MAEACDLYDEEEWKEVNFFILSGYFNVFQLQIILEKCPLW